MNVTLRISNCEFRICGLQSAIRNPQSAFSLVELVISMAILAVGIVGAMRVFPVGLRASQRAELNSRAALEAQRTIESLKLKSWEELAEGETTATEDGFEVVRRISRPKLEHLVDSARLKAIEVHVRSMQNGRPRELTFITYVRRES